jgi:4-amino-4-deoxy-L-arabinose transferase-like glycosyltransferase
VTDRRLWLAGFAVYLLAQVAVRLMVGPALELDEAEAFWFARELAWGYNAQPPLYFWLQWTVFQIVGEGVLALALLKAVLIWGAAAALFLWLAGRVDVAQAGVVVLALALLPQVVWEAQRALTHSVLVFACAVWFVVVLHRMETRGNWGDVVVLGLVTGLGVIAKYNFVLVPLGFLLALAVSRAGRRVDWRRVAVAMGIAALVVAPVAVWALLHRDVAGGSLHKLGLDGPGFVMARVQGIGSLILGAASFLALAVVVLGGFWVTRERRAAMRPEVMRYLVGGVAGACSVLVLGVLIAGATEVKDRWLLPILWPLVPAAVLWLWPVISARQRRGLGFGVGALWIVAMLALPYAALRDPGYRSGEFAVLEAALDGRGPVVSDVMWVLGNLAYRNPDMALVWAGSGGGPGVLVAEAGQGAALADRLGLLAGPFEVVDIPRGTRIMRVEVADLRAP